MGSGLGIEEGNGDGTSSLSCTVPGNLVPARADLGREMPSSVEKWAGEEMYSDSGWGDPPWCLLCV